jgi:colanic acid biosynthesis glycosyl transferase WcaI
MSPIRKPSALILYHFFHPDDVVSARHYSDFAAELVGRGWDVTVLTSDRYCRRKGEKIGVRKERWKNIQIIRIRRMGWDQGRNIWRIANGLWMMIGWAFKLMTLPRPDVIIMGSDPQFSQFLFPFIKILAPKSILVYWCFDLYPEAILADGANPIVRWAAKKSKHGIKNAYKSLDLLADIGKCMGRRLAPYEIQSQRATLTPWALVEPSALEGPDPAMRYELFGDADLALLYSGNMGKAHDFEIFLKLARALAAQNPKISFCFACRGNRYEELKEAVSPRDSNIRFAPFAKESGVEERLTAADFHLLSLQPGWEGVVIPSKFFGSLAVGKPVLYAGPEGSSIAHWIKEFNLGLVLSAENLPQIAAQILRLAKDKSDLRIWEKNARHVYEENFSKKKVMDEWDLILRSLIKRKRAETIGERA